MYSLLCSFVYNGISCILTERAVVTKLAILFQNDFLLTQKVSSNFKASPIDLDLNDTRNWEDMVDY